MSHDTYDRVSPKGTLGAPELLQPTDLSVSPLDNDEVLFWAFVAAAALTKQKPLCNAEALAAAAIGAARAQAVLTPANYRAEIRRALKALLADGCAAAARLTPSPTSETCVLCCANACRDHSRSDNIRNWAAEALYRVVIQGPDGGQLPYMTVVLGAVWTHLREYIHNKSTAEATIEDAAHVLFLRLRTAKKPFANLSHLLGWTCLAAHNIVREIMRREGHELKARVEVDREHQRVGECSHLLPPSDRTVAGEAEGQSEDAIPVVPVAMPARQVRVLQCHYRDGISYAELAKLGGRSKTAVRVDAWRGKKVIQKALRGVPPAACLKTLSWLLNTKP